MKKTIGWAVVVGGLALLVSIFYHTSVRKIAEGPRRPPLPTTESPVTPSTPKTATRPPLPATSSEKPLPALDTSDATMRNSISELWGDKALEERFHLRDFIRRVVATIDNLPRQKVAVRLLPVKPAGGTFEVDGTDNDYAISPRNAARYAPYIKLLESVDPRQLVALYRRFRPLFQQAYEDLGYPKQSFDDRLIAAIDNLLATPDVQDPIKLVRPKVFYLYADPDLEECSAGQKILLRMGRENAARVKVRLRAIRAELTRR